MFQTISHSQDENQPQFVEMEEEHEDLSFTDIGIQPYKFIEIHVTSHTMDGVGMHAKTLYQIETRVKSTKIEFRASRRYREFLSLYTQCKKLPSLISLSDMPEKKPFNRFDEKVILERQSQFQVILRELLRCGEIFVQSIFRDFLGIPQQFSLMNVLAFHKHLLYSISEISMSERQFEYDIPIEAWYHEEVKLWLASKKMLEFVDVFDRHPEWDGKTIWQFCTKGEGERLIVETTEASTEKISLFHQLRQLNTLQNLLLEKKKHHQNGDFTFDTTTGLFSNARPQKSNNNEHILLDEFFDTRDLNSTSYDPANGDAYLENNYEFLPLIEKQHLTELETRRVKCCMDKLKKLESELNENSYMILSQNLVIEDRLLYLKLNPLVASHSVLYDTSCSTIQQPLRKSLKKQKNDTPFVNLKLVITELSENAIHRLQRTLAHKFGKVNQQYGFFHTALVFGPFYLEWGDSS
ncbi:hypothetical protein C9374_006267 [Naegleria lovaniensis]|uniref:PX domain-containing protein n=1 Tax=Naegleria lovaniensis TaxID=51637 RepID=A0AA88GMD7_NAELO|nr:uncharacterized protein C9374_006267 [Naegleria lovaniensis]KAG2381278.1 hypothetical protein C9374_006267 [Naegleria lovaniensis]